MGNTEGSAGPAKFFLMSKADLDLKLSRNFHTCLLRAYAKKNLWQAFSKCVFDERKKKIKSLIQYSNELFTEHLLCGMQYASHGGPNGE